MPLSSVWHKVNNQEVPINAVWLSAVIAFCMALTVWTYNLFGSSLIHNAITQLVSLFCFFSPNVKRLIHDELSMNIVAVSWKLSSISGHGIDSNNRSLHRLCTSHLLSGDFSSQVLRSRAVQLGALRGSSGLDCCSLGGNHIGALLSTGVLPHH